jgi:hypothetical protein
VVARVLARFVVTGFYAFSVNFSVVARVFGEFVVLFLRVFGDDL